jgi:hypothetical protein
MSLERILAVLSKDHMARFKARAIEDMVGIKRTALCGKLKQFVREGTDQEGWKSLQCLR